MTKYYKLGIISTHKCNQQCYYCNNYDINYNSNDIINIDLDYLKHSLDLFNKNGINNLYVESIFYGIDINNIVRHIDNENYDGAYYRLKDIKENGIDHRYLTINDEVITDRYLAENIAISYDIINREYIGDDLYFLMYKKKEM